MHVRLHVQIPSDFLLQDVNKHKYRSLKTMMLKDPHFNREVGAQTWIYNAPVATMSTVHQLGSVVKMVKWRPGKKSTNAKKAREAFGDGYEKEMLIPLCIEDYNQQMGDVDVADQLRSYYNTQLTSFRTWWHAFRGIRHDDHQCLYHL